jgi:hypothetical protein
VAVRVASGLVDTADPTSKQLKVDMREKFADLVQYVAKHRPYPVTGL